MAEFPRGTTTPHTFAEDEHRDLARGIDCSEQGFIRPCERNHPLRSRHTSSTRSRRQAVGPLPVTTSSVGMTGRVSPLALRSRSATSHRIRASTRSAAVRPRPWGTSCLRCRSRSASCSASLAAASSSSLGPRLACGRGCSESGSAPSGPWSIPRWPLRSSPSGRISFLSYGYADQSGQAWTGVSDWLPIGLAHTWKVGATGHVRYDPAKPAQSYWFGAADPAGT
jgi:hypothetical protein